MECRTLTFTTTGIFDSGEKRDFSILDPAWLYQFVGIFHSEGHVGIKKTNKGSYFPICTIKMRDDEAPLIEDLQQKLGGHVYRRRPHTGTSNPMCGWEVTNVHDIQSVLQLIQTHTLIPAKKRFDVELVLEFIDWRLAQTSHGVDWTPALGFVERLRAIRVFKVLGDG